MTVKTRFGMRGSLGGRLRAAFLVVAMFSIMILTIAALVGTDRGMVALQRSQREHAVDRVTQEVVKAYERSGNWYSADLIRARGIAEAANAQLLVRDTRGAMVWPGRGLGAKAMFTQKGLRQSEWKPVVVHGVRVGFARLVFSSAATTGRQTAWTWVLGAAGAALVVALAVSWYITRWLTIPLRSLAQTARAFARGDRTARSGVLGLGELGEVGQALNHLADEVSRSESVRRHLAADVAHELRTPLSAVVAGLEELRDGYGTADPSRLAALHDQALRLGRIVDDLAELAAAEDAALSLRWEDVDLAVVAERILTERDAQLRSADLVVESDIQGPLPVRGDGDRLYQVIGNLLANAGRYCRPGDHVRLRAVVDAGFVVVEVADTGPGIDSMDLPHVFERLWRGAKSRGVAGSGIGLAVVRELVEAHGGTVSVNSTVGHGATFTIRLPAAGALSALS